MIMLNRKKKPLPKLPKNLKLQKRKLLDSKKKKKKQVLLSKKN